MRTTLDRGRLGARLLLLLLGATAFGACGDSATGLSGSDLFMRYRANGTLIEYSLPAGLLATVSNTTGQSNAGMTGNDGGATYLVLTVWKESGSPEVVITEGSFRTARVN